MKLEKIVAERERVVKENDILTEIMHKADSQFSVEDLEFVKEIKNKYSHDLEKALGDKADEWLDYYLDSP